MAWYYDRGANVMVESVAPRPDLFAMVVDEAGARPLYEPAAIEQGPRTLDEIRDAAIRRAVVVHNGNMAAAARQLGVTHRTMMSNVKRLGLRTELGRVVYFTRGGRARKYA